MKIEETPYQFGNSPINDKLHHPLPMEAALDEMELSFLDLLNSHLDNIETPAAKADKPEQSSPRKEPESKAEEARPGRHLSLVTKAENSSAAPTPEDPTHEVEAAMTLLKTDLTATDVQYLKQVVVPGVPILMGTVPFQSIFPVSAEGEISYKGFEISPKLAELIEKGYKTGKPIRVELDPATAVVLKIRNGQVSAEFLSTDKAMAMYMKQELDDLKNRMQQRNLPVGTLEARQEHHPRRDDRKPHHSEDTDE